MTVYHFRPFASILGDTCNTIQLTVLKSLRRLHAYSRAGPISPEQRSVPTEKEDGTEQSHNFRVCPFSINISANRPAQDEIPRKYLAPFARVTSFSAGRVSLLVSLEQTVSRRPSQSSGGRSNYNSCAHTGQGEGLAGQAGAQGGRQVGGQNSRYLMAT